jgi:secondary thiamine-phosphate synthase enzyme
VITFQSKKPHEVVNITNRVKATLEKSGFRDGIILVPSLHSNCAVNVNDDESGLLEDLEIWLTQVALAQDNFKHQGRFESDAAAHFQALLLHHQVFASFTEGHLDLGPWQSMPLDRTGRPAPQAHSCESDGRVGRAASGDRAPCP